DAVTTDDEQRGEAVRVRPAPPLPVVDGLGGPPAHDAQALIPLPDPAALRVVVGAALAVHAGCPTGSAANSARRAAFSERPISSRSRSTRIRSRAARRTWSADSAATRSSSTS